MFWLTGYQTIGYFTFQAMFIPATGLPIVITRIVNRDMALALSTIGDVEPIYDTQNHIDVLINFLKAHLAPESNVGLETEARYLTVKDYRQLLNNSYVKFIDWDGFIQQQRIVKTEDENRTYEKSITSC